MVIALDKRKRPLGFITERRARILMEKRRAVNYRVYPSVVIIKDVDSRTIDTLPTYRIKIDPGSKYTGIAVVDN
ncbi:MAG: RRXRR domain-containing protein, partial [Lachnospiraceae bacterium]|nr:RRXRR domain-containing protein [Lachnospiraceae bacterium]